LNRQLNPLDLDAIREMGSIGAGHAATALSQLAGFPVKMAVPRISVVPPETILATPESGANELLVMHHSFCGRLRGDLLVIMTAAQSKLLADILTGKILDIDTAGDEVEDSALAEAGNIMVSSFLNQMSFMTGLELLPSPPRLLRGYRHLVVEVLGDRIRAGAPVLLFQTSLELQTSQVGIELMMLPEPGALETVLETLAAYRKGSGR